MTPIQYCYACIVALDRKSFPSGHSAAACYEALYLVTLAVGGAIFISISRLQDHHHHVTDVIGGAVTGISGCVITILFHSELTKEYVPPSKIDQYREWLAQREKLHSKQTPKQGKKAKRKDKKNKKTELTSGNGVKDGIDNKGFQRESVVNIEDDAQNEKQSKKQVKRPETPEIIITDTEEGDNDSTSKRTSDIKIAIDDDDENTKM
ncbi:hypothetical protein KUTeg_001551 [Tegillarca granosa]|uniref:Phosphatidic acid phosphatase type 2/haloperoxidase domain-containing protein n=1 Tax=Tegillarca granosa TaxID=220873 RepID=A0ABQ9FRS4_TEGGR|nr:hypothetical protein KUTeg_001551 [Tegillarca granosa]